MKYQYTNENHFVFGYLGHKPYGDRRHPSDQFCFQYGKVLHSDMNWREANRLAAESIRKNFTGDIWILYSGGTDSEVCLHAFREAGIDVKIATLRFHNQLNSHDLEYVEKYSRATKQPIHFFDLDIENFWSSERLYQYVDPIQCVSPVLAYHLWLADQVPGVPVLAQGEPYLAKQVSENDLPGVSLVEARPWSIVESERLCSLYKHFIKKQSPAVPGFFQYTPEQIFSFCFHNPIMSDLVQNKIPGKLGTRSSKNQMIHQFYPEIELRQKYTGIEKIEPLHDSYRAQLAKRFPYHDANARLEWSELKRSLLPIPSATDLIPR